MVEAAAAVLTSLFSESPAAGIVLGSGFSELPRLLGCRGPVPYSDLPNFPDAGVDGHDGAVWCLDTPSGFVAIFSGRFHGYEDHPREIVGLPVSLLARLGAKRVLLTCAAGGVDTHLEPGELFLVSDHLNLMGWNPLQQIPARSRRPSFLDLSECYDPGLTDGIHAIARRRGVHSTRGVLAAVCGPTYETPAEVRMLERLGAEAVCMSTVPEAILARYHGLGVAVIAIIANRAAGYESNGITHENVLSVVERSVRENVEFFRDVAAFLANGEGR